LSTRRNPATLRRISGSAGPSSGPARAPPTSPPWTQRSSPSGWAPSLDTPTCDTETRRFNQEAAKVGGGRGGLDDQPRPAIRATLSDFCERAFGPAYGVEIKDGPLAASSRARSSSSARTASSGTSALAAAKSVAG